MTIPRFTTLQLLLAAAWCALVLGLATGSWRASTFSQVTAVRFSPGGKYLAARYASGSIQIWEMSGPRPRRVAGLRSSSPWPYDSSGLHFLDKDTLIDVPCRTNGLLIKGEVRTLSLASGKLQTRFAWQFSSDGLQYAAAGDTVALMDRSNRLVYCYSLHDARVVQRIGAAMPVWEYALTPDGRALLMPDHQSGSVTVFDVGTGSVLRRESEPRLVTAAISNDGLRLAVAFISPADGATHIRILGRSPEPRTISPDPLNANWVAFTADGSQVAAAGYDAAELFDVTTGRRTARIAFAETHSPRRWATLGAMHRSGVPGQFSLSPDGRTLATFDGHRVLLWDFASGKLRRSLASDSRTAQIVAFVALFALWSAAWGIVARSQRERELGTAACLSHTAPTPIELKLCWGMMLIGGLVALGISIGTLVFWGPLVWPMMYVALMTGMAATARGAARETRGLERIALLQLINIAACDPVNFLLGTLAQNLLRRPHVRQYLQLTARPPTTIFL